MLRVLFVYEIIELTGFTLWGGLTYSGGAEFYLITFFPYMLGLLEWVPGDGYYGYDCCLMILFSLYWFPRVFNLSDEYLIVSLEVK